MKDDNIKLRQVLSADIKFLKDHGIMDYSLLLSAEKYSANTVKKDNGGLIDPETPKDLNADELNDMFTQSSINGPSKMNR